ncbi:COBW domain-containing protein 1, putative [Plasmodium berghei]|uniref:COBW domain-containing protein 1, putative n=2 Tax=Plasmodium berghei TaxID=5821 RepID=A0A509AL96_PLABA|nr:COBW domain-containing protein 1, putative [Plasmodium berghei ANKA]CXI56507.1 COBW domain-containing protein 1, putative [Plasmodium berghei]SCL95372.1 COBW domain-containing protein 1, putative [Plasmodium berghei]SCM16242.1 COBW domain-containing protein 1, putative [Plasmodium berghei]SCM18038.1 COBW domain-containing protein 1, putative [Plasmodium berghei]SCN26477.1 COBW domain-containing protein 1, putative [Plasmodium berghei]|eukprot:XP_034422166.1 COBW domain-containing protein 1, putative [Plasmodium berghei ANKA]
MIGITIITGFLGAGKTTLLKNLLKDSLKNKLKIAIIHNEFTENNNNIDKIVFKDINDIYNFPKSFESKKKTANNVDDKTETLEIVNKIESKDGFIYELNNGCLCCSNKSNFVKLIEMILEKKTAYDFIFVEVSGVYDNVEINNLLWIDKLNKSKIYLDSIIHIIDSYNFMRYTNSNIAYYDHLKEISTKANSIQINQGNVSDQDRNKELQINKKEASTINELEPIKEDDIESSDCKQLIVCDVIIINKIDKINDKEKEDIKNFIENINPLSVIHMTSYSNVPIELITNLKCYEQNNFKGALVNIANNNSNKKHKNGVYHYNNFINFSIQFQHDIPYLIYLSKDLNDLKQKFINTKNYDFLKNIISLKKKNIFSYKKINNLLASLLWNTEMNIYRGKGIFVAFNDDIYTNKNKLKLNIYYYQSVGELYEINTVMTDIHFLFQNYFDNLKKRTNTPYSSNCTSSFDAIYNKESDVNNKESDVNNKESDVNNKESDVNNKENDLNNKESDIYNKADLCTSEHSVDAEDYLSCDSSDTNDSEYNIFNILNDSNIFESNFLFIGKDINIENLKIQLNECLINT